MGLSAAPLQVDGFSARIKPEPKEVEEEEEEGIGDVDLFSLINEHTKLTINAKWLQHLQVQQTPQNGLPFHNRVLREITVLY